MITVPNYTEELHKANELDPLALGRTLAEDLPEINRDGATGVLIDHLQNGVETVSYTDFIGQPRLADAALRDLDFLASSLVRQGGAITDVIGLESILTLLSDEAGTVPRGTVYTYALQNPLWQERSFTGTAEESFFIDKVRESGAVMLSQCTELLTIDPSMDSSESISSVVAETADSMKVVVSSMVEVSRVVGPEFFTHKMRPFFAEIAVNGETYAGAGGAQLPLVVIDRIVWGGDNYLPAYQAYFADNIRYQPADLRRDLMESSYHQSLLGHLANRQAMGEDMSSAFEEVTNLMKQVKRFRMPHRKVAKDNFQLRPEAAVGSGQYTPSLLDTLIDLTDKAIAESTRMQSGRAFL